MKFTILSIFIFLSALTAEIPAMINYQGILTNTNGTVVDDNTYNLSFSIYDVASGGSTLWSEAHTGVEVTQGLFNIMLGSVTPLDIPFDVQYYLGISVNGGDEVAPRIAFSSTAYSFSARSIRENTGFGVVPIGSILPWHKSLNETPNLPDGWAECNGQVVSDDSSPYNGQTIPDLNGTGQFVRGGTVSGNTQSDETKTHSHDITHNHIQQSHDHPQYSHDHPQSAHSHTDNPPAEWGYQEQGSSGTVRRALFGFRPANNAWGPDREFINSANPAIGGETADNQPFTAINYQYVDDSSPDGGSETRPVNISMVWIMRIK